MKERRRIRYLIIAAYLCSLANFVFDWITPHGVANWVLYIPIILTPIWYNNSRHILYASSACSILVVIGFFVSPPGIVYSWAVWNRVFVLAALWLTALAGMIIVNRSNQYAATLMLVEEESKRRRQAEERLHLAVEGAGMGTFDVNFQAGKVIWSATHLRMLGYEEVSERETTVDLWRSCVHPDDLDRVLEARQVALRCRSAYSIEYRITRADDRTVVWLAVFGRFHYNDSGEAVRLVGVSFDITRRKELERAVLEIVAREQRQIGQELHDGVGQELTGLGLMAQTLAQLLPESAEEKQIACRLIAGLDSVHHKVRELSRGLIPVHVESRGLSSALRDLAARTTEVSGVRVTAECPEWVELPDQEVSTQLFRIAQEAVNNAIRHGRPRHVRLTLLTEPKGLRLRIYDDGVGIQHDQNQSDGLGLSIMEYRAGLIGGVLQVTPSQGGGTVVTCTVPRSQGNVKKECETCCEHGESPDRG